MARATTSFPVPLSPVISTVASVGATISISSTTFFMAGLLPISSVLGKTSWRFSRSRTTSRRARLCSSALYDQVRQLVRIHRLGDVIVGARA